jgi:23S rRNA (uracil1939-C5)-methyltransferase
MYNRASMEIILASASPRRRELMSRVAPEFRVHPVTVDESSVREKDPVRFAIAAAVLKARSASEAFPDAAVIGADTVVALGNRILGKPDGRDEARAMIRALSGQRHRVITGIAFYRRREDRLFTGHELTYVTFRPLTEEMIEDYLAKEDFLDKAGAYAVQDVGDAFVRRLRGDYDNVVGFPVKRVTAMLARFLVPALTVTVEDIDFPGSRGVAKHADKLVLVPGTVPGDKLRVQVVGESRGNLLAETIRMDRASPSRVAPPCPHFGTCGGCLFQHVEYGAQLELKRRHLRRVLYEAGVAARGTSGAPLEVPAVMPSPDVYHYRNKMEFAFAERWGELVIGLREKRETQRRSRGRTAPLSQCPIFSAMVESIFPEVLAFARERGLSAYNARTGRGSLRHLVLREAKRTGDLLVALVTSSVLGKETDFAALAERLAAALPRLKGFAHVTNSRRSDVVSFEETAFLTGTSGIEEKLGGLVFRVHFRTFFQTNTAAAEILYGKIAELAGLDSGSRVLGLYCGSGAIELSLARRAGRVTGIDSLAENIRNAEENAAANGIGNAEFITGTVEEALGRFPIEPPDVVILDPPRPGLSPRAMKRVLAMEVPKIVYVSCNPEALARDLKSFLAWDYGIEAILPFDFFPHTPHLEALAILCKQT